MATCPDGHQSAYSDYCEVCGLPIGSMSSAQPAADAWGSPSRSPGAAGSAAQQPPPAAGSFSSGGAPPGDGRACPNCHTLRAGRERFCEGCGLDYNSGRLPDGSMPSAGGQAQPTPTMVSQPPPGGSPWGPPQQPQPPPPPSNGGGPSGYGQQGYGPTQAISPTGSSYGTPIAPSAPSEGRPSWGAPPPPHPREQPVHSMSPPRPLAWDASLGPASVPGTAWVAIVGADRAYFDSVQAAGGPDAGGISFPSYYAERQFALSRPEMRIGRFSASRGISPEIDLTGPPTDPGISRLHAVLIGRSGSWFVRDLDSANGTLVNGIEVPADQEIELRDGDRVNLGAWTAITVRRS